MKVLAWIRSNFMSIILGSVLLLLLNPAESITRTWMEAGNIHTLARRRLMVMDVIWLICDLWVLLAAAFNFKALFKLADRNKLMVLLFAMVPLSLAWTGHPNATLTRSACLVGNVLVAALFAIHMPLDRQLRVLRIFFGAYMIACLFFIWIFPDYGIMTETIHAGRWRGLFGQKNHLGLGALLTLLLMVSAWSMRMKWLPKAGIITASLVSLLLIFKSVSVNSYFCTMVMITLFIFFRILKKDYSRRVWISLALAGTAVLAAYFVAQNLDAVLGALGRSRTLTGRTDIWDAVVRAIAQKPWLGYGYNGFWQLTSPAYQELLAQVEWKGVNGAHNGFLDLTLQLGLTGLALFLVLLVRCLVLAWRWAISGKNGTDDWPLIFLVYLVLINMVESKLMRPNDPHAFLLYLTMFTLLIRPVAGKENAA